MWREPIVFVNNGPCFIVAFFPEKTTLPPEPIVSISEVLVRMGTKIFVHTVFSMLLACPSFPHPNINEEGVECEMYGCVSVDALTCGWGQRTRPDAF